MIRAAAQADRLDATAHAFADPTRRRILTLVRDREVSAGELAEHFTHLSRPAVSQHLRVLRSAELVSVRNEGPRRMYRGQPDGLAEMRTFIDEMWTDRLAHLKRAVENSETPAHPRPEKKAKR